MSVPDQGCSKKHHVQVQLHYISALYVCIAFLKRQNKYMIIKLHCQSI